jgi:hypothetical protein
MPGEALSETRHWRRSAWLTRSRFIIFVTRTYEDCPIAPGAFVGTRFLEIEARRGTCELCLIHEGILQSTPRFSDQGLTCTVLEHISHDTGQSPCAKRKGGMRYVQPIEATANEKVPPVDGSDGDCSSGWSNFLQHLYERAHSPARRLRLRSEVAEANL